MTAPNLFIIGTPKAATTTIHEILSGHQEIYMSETKEPHYFSSIGKKFSSYAKISQHEEYMKLFENAGSRKYIGESSVSYMHDKKAMYEIKRNSPSAKIVIMLRDPVSRMYSHWLMDVRDGIQKKNFRAAVLEDYARTEKGFGVSHMYIECSLYANQIKSALELFGRDSVFIGFFEDFIADNTSFMLNLYRWLGVQEDDTFIKIKSNPSSEPKNKIFKFLYHNQELRSALRNILPRSAKSSIRSMILKPAPNKKISVEDKDYFKDYFSADIEKLRELAPWDYDRWL